MNRLARVAMSALLSIGLAAAVSAEVRTLEAVGTVPIDPTGQATGIPRDNAINQALREAVMRVAQDFLADRWIEDPSVDDETDDTRILDPNAPDQNLRTPEPPDLEAVLGQKMVPYTSRFRVIEDRGRRAALFAEDPEVREEYVVIVEVHVDADRVQAKLVDAGLIPAGESTLAHNEILLEVDGLNAYPAYLELRSLLEGTLAAQRVTPVEMSRGRTLLDVETSASAVEFLEALLTATPRNLEIVPVKAEGNRVHVSVTWNPRPPE